jgi:hypothetical protein
VHGLGHQASDIRTDVRSARGGRPDVTVDGRLAEQPLLRDWIVTEVKDEPDAFAPSPAADRIFAGKWRYVGPDTDWFIGIDPMGITVRRVTNRLSAEQPSADRRYPWTRLELLGLRSAEN